MSRYDDYMEFVVPFVDSLPAIETIATQNIDFWNKLEINVPRILEDASDPNWIAENLSMGLGGLMLLSVWAGLNPQQNIASLLDSLTEYFHANRNSPQLQTLIFINEFLKWKRDDAIEEISRLQLAGDLLDSIHLSGIDQKSKRFCYALAVFIQNTHNLGIMMLYERAEKAGYTRYVLVPKTEDAAGRDLDEESVMLTQQCIDQGVNLDGFTINWLNNLLEEFEAQREHRQCLCWEIYKDVNSDMLLVFIFRTYRESYIREIGGVIFGDEAELIVLRISDEMRIVEEHSNSGIGIEISAAAAAALYQDASIQYVKATNLTNRNSFSHFVNVLVNGEDQQLRLRELYLKSAPIRQAPILILRSEKTSDLSIPLEYLRQKGLDLLQNLQDIRSLKVAFVVTLEDDVEMVYSFTVYCKYIRANDFFLPFSVANIATNICRQFESYLEDNYNVRVIPGTI